MGDPKITNRAARACAACPLRTAERSPFQVNKNRPRARAVYTASLRERRDGISIYREVKGVAPASAFRFDPNLRAATHRLRRTPRLWEERRSP